MIPGIPSIRGFLPALRKGGHPPVAAEWTAVVSMFLGFCLLMSFAVYNTYFQ